MASVIPACRVRSGLGDACLSAMPALPHERGHHPMSVRDPMD